MGSHGADNTDQETFGGATRTVGPSDTVYETGTTVLAVGGTNNFGSTGNLATAANKADGISASAGAESLKYANAYYGIGGDMLYLDSKPDAVHGGNSIAMDITYTGPSGSCSVQEVTKGSKESAVCSNRGVCDYETGTCVCAEGFMKEACSEQSVLV